MVPDFREGVPSLGLDCVMELAANRAMFRVEWIWCSVVPRPWPSACPRPRAAEGAHCFVDVQ